MQWAPPLLLLLLLLCPFVTAFFSSSSSSFCYSIFCGVTLLDCQAANCTVLNSAISERTDLHARMCFLSYCFVSWPWFLPPSFPPLASLETEEYFWTRTIMILGCCSCCCVFGPSFSSSERGSWTTSKEAAAVQTTTVGEALQKLLTKERRVVHKGFHGGFSGNRFIHYSLFAWNRYIFFLFKKYKKCYHVLHWKIERERERESPHI